MVVLTPNANERCGTLSVDLVCVQSQTLRKGLYDATGNSLNG